MQIKFVGSFETVKSLPRTQFAEYAFIGRSNVGKSSLVNAIAGSVIARTSKTPGRTQSLNLFNVADRVMLTDLPGYGYAKISKETADRWLARLEDYLLTRGQLKTLFILIDARVGLKDSDLDLMNFCDRAAVPYQMVLTKIDKSNKSDITKIHNDITCGPRPAMCAEILDTSSEKGLGIEILRKIIGIK
ncbi:MAG: ribosome biogenesis GTP-binding protein YihA/YsxC [Rickettsiales bacterium]|jgi:GTP-binding protein|nr:ribosome biogenesis GTP-binding protein YihA/YsxC [Rickettsiales bacterium]